MLKGIFRAAGVAAAVFAASLASAASARTIYECQIEDRGTNRGWLPAVVIVSVDPGSETVTVADPMIEYVHGGPIDLEPRANNDARLSVSWKLTLPATDQDEVTVSYDFTILKTSNSARIKGSPRGYDNAWVSEGSCKVLKG